MPEMPKRWAVLPLLIPLLLAGASGDARAEGPGKLAFCERVLGYREALEAKLGLIKRVENIPVLQALVDEMDARLADACVQLNEIQVIGSHNSYHVEPVQELIDVFVSFDPAAIAWEYTHPPLPFQFGMQGIRQIELDVFADPDGGLYATRIALSLIGQPIESGELELDLPGMKVLHVQHADFDTTCLSLVSCLMDVRDWSDANPGHLPIAILIEAKDDAFFVPILPVPVRFRAERFRELDAEILSVFPPERILLPDDVRGRHDTLEEAVLTDGWPSLKQVRGKVLFLLDNGGVKRDRYRDGADSLEGRVIFTSSTPGEPDAAFVKVNDPLSDPTLIPELVQAGYLVRTRADSDTEQARSGDTTQRDAALASGAHWVSTDYADPDPRRTDYTVELPGGLVARCNPVNPSAFCRDTALGD